MLENFREPWRLVLPSIGLTQLVIQRAVAIRCEDKASAVCMIGLSIWGDINVWLHWILICLTDI